MLRARWLRASLALIPLAVVCLGMTSAGVESVVNQPTLLELEAIGQGVCRVEREDGGHGSGVAFKRVGHETYVLTAKHVVMSEFGVPLTDFIVRFSVGQTFLTEPATIGWTSDLHDLAVLVVKDSMLKIVPVIDREATKDATPGFPCLALGYPGPMFPAVITLGHINNIGDENTEATSAGYFGNSGGPLIDARTGRVIGIVVFGVTREGEFMDSPLWAVGARAIWDFIGDLAYATNTR